MSGLFFVCLCVGNSADVNATKMEDQKLKPFRKIIAYKYFSNSQDFEHWQTETQREIFQIQPMMGGIKMTTDIHNINGDSQIGVIVTYVSFLMPENNNPLE